MLAMIGAFLGLEARARDARVLSSVAGSVIGLFVIVLKRGDMKYALPLRYLSRVAALGHRLPAIAL